MRFAESWPTPSPDARFLVIPRAAHAVIFDAAERFNAAILEFSARDRSPLGLTQRHRGTEISSSLCLRVSGEPEVGSHHSPQMSSRVSLIL
jgi:hypothetical protein